MPNRSVTIPHDYSQEKARSYLEAFFDLEASKYGITGNWIDQTYRFEAHSQVGKITGNLQVEPSSIQCSMAVPIIALPFTGWLPGMIQYCLKRGSQILLERNQQFKRQDDSTQSTPTAIADPLILYLHIPKTGGISLSDYIYAHCRLPNQGPGDASDPLIKDGVFFCPIGFVKPPDLEMPDYTRKMLSRPDLKAFVGHFWYGIHRLTDRDCKYITVLRNPVDRMVSLYYYLEANKHMSLENFVSQPSLKELDNDQTRRIAGTDPAIGECNRDTLEMAIENLNKFAVVGVTEEMVNIERKLKAVFGWKDNTISMGFKNTGHNKPKAQSLTEAERSAILKANTYDIELYQYVLRQTQTGRQA